MPIYKNKASQKVAVLAIDVGNSPPTRKTGDAANISAQISKDAGASAALTDTNPTELDATNHPGVYIFDLTQVESNADSVLVTPSSSTANIVLDPLYILTESSVAQTGDSYARLGAPAGASVSADIAVIDGVADALTGQIAGLNNLSAVEVWGSSPRTLTGFGFNVDLNADQSGVTIGTVTTNSDMVTAAQLEAALVNDGDATAFLQAVADKIAGDLTTGDVTAQAIASATRDAILDRALAGSHDTAGTPGALLQTVATLLTAAGYTAPPTAAAIADAVWDEAQGDHVAAGSFGLYLDAAISGVSVGGLTAQQVADALKLAPATGGPATGSVYAGLETILGRTAGGIVVSSSFIASDGVTLLLSQGEAYTTAVSNPIEISIKDARLQPTITSDGTTVTLKLAPRNGVGDKLEITGTIIAHHSETSTADVRFEMTAVQSAGLKAGARAYRWDVEFLIANNAANVVTSIIDAPSTIAEQVA